MAGASRIADARMNGARRLARPRVAGGRGNRGSRGGFSGAHRRGGDEELRELCWWWVVVERRRRLVGQWKHKLEWASNEWPGKGNAAWHMPNWRVFSIFIFFKNIFYKNIFLVSQFTVLYKRVVPCRPLPGSRPACRPPPGGRGLHAIALKF